MKIGRKSLGRVRILLVKMICKAPETRLARIYLPRRSNNEYSTLLSLHQEIGVSNVAFNNVADQCRTDTVSFHCAFFIAWKGLRTKTGSNTSPRVTCPRWETKLSEATAGGASANERGE